MSTDQVQLELPESLIGAIEAVAISTMTPQRRYEAILLIVIGYGLYHQLDTYSPGSIAIPSKQWGHICNLLTEMERDSIGAVNWALSWMNQGPSGYEPTPKEVLT